MKKTERDRDSVDGEKRGHIVVQKLEIKNLRYCTTARNTNILSFICVKSYDYEYDTSKISDKSIQQQTGSMDSSFVINSHRKNNRLDVKKPLLEVRRASITRSCYNNIRIHVHRITRSRTEATVIVESGVYFSKGCRFLCIGGSTEVEDH